MQLWSVEYEMNGYIFSMHVFGTREEVLTHADNLGLGEPEMIEAVIQNEINNRLN